ncbi:MAG: hypothetical protein IPN59_05885 [Holophaga sp.]|nr:hypothetical protein [Holophaga sp.]
MASTLRHLLIQRAARLQDLPAFSAPEWGTLNYFQLRNRVEGVALGLMASPLPEAGFFASTNTPWDWICEVAAACCGLPWTVRGEPVVPEILGGCRFNDENGRQPYHDREEAVLETTPFLGALSQAHWLQRLQRLNGELGWDHTSTVAVPMAALGTEGGRGALWSALFAGGHARLVLAQKPTGFDRILGKREKEGWNPAPFQSLFSE